MERALTMLPNEDRDLISMRYGLNGPPMTLRECAVRLGVSDERVRQRQARAIQRLRLRMKRAGAPVAA